MLKLILKPLLYLAITNYSTVYIFSWGHYFTHTCTVQLNLNLTANVWGNYITQHGSKNTYNIASMYMKDWWCERHIKWIHVCTHEVRLLSCALWFTQAHMCFTHFTCFSGVYSDLAYTHTQVCNNAVYIATYVLIANS